MSNFTPPHLFLLRRRMMMMNGTKGIHPFSVGPSRKVQISPGNLQYQASTGLWRFAPNQYDYIGNGPGNTTSENRDTQADWIDMFGWATSGWHGDSAWRYQPWDSNDVGNQYPSYPNLTGQYANGDWGIYNPIGDDPAGTWRTLLGSWDSGQGEWYYLLFTRPASTINGVSNARYTKATVAGVPGLILFPDVYEHPSKVMQPASINEKNAAFTVNIYSETQWSLMELAGAAFLPAAGKRQGTNVSSVGDSGNYWTALNQQYITFQQSNVDVAVWSTGDRGLSIRLVKDLI